MLALTLAEIAAAVGGRLADADPGAVVDADVVVDSRLAGPGGLFAALAGEHDDGHRHAAAAVSAGAAAVLAARPVGVPAVVVDDVVAALGRLAAAVLRRTDVVVVGITGSSGKTSTKDLTGALLARVGPTVAAAGSYNNEIGLPLTVLRVGPASRHLVLEYSARGPGHIAYLAGIAPPRLAAELNVGSAHLGEFGSREAIAAAKAELVEALPAGGVAVLNADDPLVAAMAGRTSARVVRVGCADGRGDAGGDLDVTARDVTLDAAGRASYRLLTPAGSVPVRLAVAGAHQVPNSLAAAALALECGLPVEQVAAGLAEARPVSRWRMEVTERGDGVTVVNDAYNANPESVAAALRALVAIGAGRPARRWAVLGEMRELGEAGPAAHAAAGELAARLGVDRVVAVGPAAAGVAAGARAGGGSATAVGDVTAAVALLRDELRPGDVVLVKASRAARLERVAEALLAEPGAGGPAERGAGGPAEPGARRSGQVAG